MFTADVTPALVVDRAILEANLERVAAQGRSLGARLRPHVKTHKCLAIAELQLRAGAEGLTVATVAEAEVFARVSDDIFIAYPLWVDEAKAERIRALPAAVSLGVDSAEAAVHLARWLPGQRVLVEVDSGHHRSGVAPARAGAVARSAADAGLDVAGVFTFPGHSYAPGGAGEAALDERTALAAAVASFAAAGLTANVVSGGSTPSLPYAESGLITELRPGVYVVGDAQQWELGSCTPEQIALTCHARVVSLAGGRVVLDSGSKILGADRAGWASGFGRLLDHPEARVVLLSEHHAVAEFPPGTPLPEWGSVVRVVPNHACNAINLVDDLLVDAGDGRTDRWSVAARGANT